ncbi:MAG: hypothetical protein BHV76_11080 [Phocaeicola plebeius]|uniref:Uncharacterized protein n=1 Tax=Phocaeicola plebeius TaxID=310297 RepID=A0A854BTV7_9BACT|nr:MAG: hypothetical protein BHV76_11080 [Phocaeicola plebeius]
MKNTVQKYLFYSEWQNTGLKKNALQHTLTKPYSPIKSLNKYSLNLKKIKNETALSYYLSQPSITFV